MEKEIKDMVKPIAMRCTQEQFESIRPILESNGLEICEITDSFIDDCYLTNYYLGDEGQISNIRGRVASDHNREVFEEWNQDTFLEYCGIKTEQKNQIGYKLTVPVTEVLKIHAVACGHWKSLISRDYLSRVDEHQNVTFTKEEVDTMFLAVTTDQSTLLMGIFGEIKAVIDYDKLKTGSRVMIQRSGYEIYSDINFQMPVYILFYKTPHHIYINSEFVKSGHYPEYITFAQNGKFALFNSNINIDYITEVFEY